jgi:hypothetical protein
MSGRAKQRLRSLLFVAALGLPAAGAPAAPAAAPLAASRELVARLRAAGRAEAELHWSVPGPAGTPVPQRGSLALEPPSLARLTVPATGERVTLRADGGEWLQPGLRQLVRLTPRHAGAAMRWWRLLAGGGAGDDGWARERRLAPGRYRIVVGGPGGPAADSAEVWLDARGLPSRLVLGPEGDAQEYRLSGWRFRRARGARDFRLSAPAGYEDVDLP